MMFLILSPITISEQGYVFIQESELKFYKVRFKEDCITFESCRELTSKKNVSLV